ncbi:putative ARS binding protein Abp2 [Aspergillus steynii IBT 23096]|uniref:Putative ARS binding protein Abp2 n=1 Tax=Aspergillus steynii IBT 23096 TaxID=1392250 RepID=A0A2I2FXB5_9EURO|nr:putative ARS binding protein Abp2 [Aspergillus steynii IBT 23096]PLB45252.1 putative ARS binding protein Abp2 [Aspergillus steynii IBT 23096]
MEGPFPNVMNQPDRNELGNPPMVIQQYARYPPTLEPGMHSASSLGSARSRLPASKSPPLNRKATPRSLQASPTGVRSGPPPPTTAAPPGPSMSPPMFDPLRQRQPRESMDQPESRSLPSREIKDDTIDDAYVAFIFYCNPNVPPSTDTSELRKTFRSPPRSDGKSFSIFTLWELIRKLDNKELKTWISLATELGVEPPVMEKGQSTQKVQQYAVRLKRWMRAMHVDAFFEYCLGHPHVYYNQIPTNNAVVSDSRDGVPLEEDLALRALVPQWKPKRGRKRAEERDIIFDRVTKRPSLDTSVSILHPGPFPGHSATFPPSAMPFSAFPEEIETHDPWMAAPSAFPTAGHPDSSAAHHGPDPRWKPLERDASPAGYPQSAIIPRHHHPSEVYMTSTEPRSAVTPSSGDKPRPKRRHGPAVSSAWPNNNGSSTGKTRGRPPNRGTVSGPFSSFPVNPNRADPSQIHQPTSRPSPAILLDHDASHRFSQPQYQQSPTPFPGPRPNKLQLQVPHHSGAPVRLATPPTLMVNGINNPPGPLKIEGSQRNGASAPAHEMHSAIAPHPQMPIARNGHSNADIISDDAVRVLAGELLRAKVTGRPAPLNAEEARNLAVSVVTTLTSSYSHAPLGSPVLMAVLHLGLGPHFGYPGVMESAMVVHVELAPGPPAIMAGAPGPGGASPNFVYSVSHEYKHGLRFTTKVTYGDLAVGKSDSNKRESISRITDDLDNSIPEVDSLTDAEFEVDGADSNASEMTWKQRYMKMRVQLQKKERALSIYKRKIIDSVMADI